MMAIETAYVTAHAFDILQVCNGIARGPESVEAALVGFNGEARPMRAL
jgi:hypothetical protein